MLLKLATTTLLLAYITAKVILIAFFNYTN